MSQRSTIKFILFISWTTMLGCNQPQATTSVKDEVTPPQLQSPQSESASSAQPELNLATEDVEGASPESPSFYTVDHYDAARDPAADLAETLNRAKAEDKRVLLQVGGEWCGWCKLMTKFIESNPAVRDKVEQNFLLMKVTWMPEQKNEEFLSQYPAINGYPHLFVLDKDGTLLHSQDTAELEEGKGYNEEVYLKFLDTWAQKK